MKKRIHCTGATGFFFIILLALAVFPLSIFAGVKEYVLDNGLKVLIIEEHKAPVATFQVWYRVGARDEPHGKSGISHLLEHMMFKGTPRFGSKEFSKIVQKNGGGDNAYTTKDYTAYYQIFSSDRISLSIDLEADRMKNLIMDSGETAAERNVVMEERRLRYDDDPQNSLYEEVMSAAYKLHTYRRPVIGWMPEIQSIGRDDLLRHYKTYYAPNNAVIVVVGDVKAEEMIEKIKSSFDNLKPASLPAPARFIEPEQRGERRATLKRDAELPYIIMAYHVPSFPNEDSYALDVLSLILSGGKSSRLYKSLVYEKKLALSASADYIGFSIDPFLFFFEATLAPGREMPVLEKAIDEEIRMISSAPPSPREVEKAKNQIESSFIMEQDSIYSQAMKYGLFEMLGGWQLIDKYISGIRNVTAEDVLRVSGKYLKEENRTVGILIPNRVTGNQQ